MVIFNTELYLDAGNFFNSLTPQVKIVSLGIVIIAIGAWFSWNPKLKSTLNELRRLRTRFEKFEPRGPKAISDAFQNTQDSNVRAILKEIQVGLFDLPGDLGVKTYSLRFYQEIWTPRALLANRVNLALYEAAPNILIGVGLFFTFVFLAFALADVIPALNSEASPELIRTSISGLLKNASGKFLTSIAGMFCSILWTWFSKQNLEALEQEIESLCVAMQIHVEDTGSEAAISAQIALLGEILNENREQVGQLRRFETDFAVAIGKALGSQMQPAFEKLTTSITEALNALTEKVGSMNEDALQKMLTDFQNAIREHSGKEMEAFKQTLVEIAARLKEAAERLEQSGGAAGKAIEAGGEQFSTILAGSAGDLRQASSLLEQAMLTAKATVNDMDETLVRATADGRLGLESLQGVLARLATVATEVTGLVGTIQVAGDNFNKAAAEASTATGNLQQVVSEQNALVTTISESAKTMEGALTSANQEFRASAEKMTSTTKEMTTGVENYSQKVAELHSSLDESLAKAIGSLNSTVSELVDGLEEFLEELQRERA